MSTPLLEIRNFKKQFRSYWTFRPITAVQDVSLTVFAGESFGFLGHNGAGKTTTIKCIAGLIHKSAGEILLNGEPLTRPEQRSILGYLPEQPYFYDHLSVFETLDFFAGLSGIPKKIRRHRVAETLEQVGLAPRAKASVRSLSKGLQQRLGLAQAIVNQPKLLLLDEPFSGLDPIGRVEVRELILSLREQGCTIFISSHILSDVQDICDRVAIMAHGRLRRVFTLSETANLFGEQYLLLLEDVTPELVYDAESIEVKNTAQGVRLLASYQSRELAEAALTRVLGSGGRLVHFRHAAPSLEEVFVRITEDAELEDRDVEFTQAHVKRGTVKQGTAKRNTKSRDRQAADNSNDEDRLESKPQ